MQLVPFRGRIFQVVCSKSIESKYVQRLVMFNPLTYIEMDNASVMSPIKNRHVWAARPELQRD